MLSLLYTFIRSYEQNYAYTHFENTSMWQMVIVLIPLLFILILPTLYNKLFKPLPTDITDGHLPFISFLYSNILPNRAASRLMRPLTHKKIPKQWRSLLFKLIGYFYPIQWHEFKKDLTEYQTFHEFFTRRLEEKRKLNKTDLVSPVDGTVIAFGEVDADTQSMEQIKGCRFKLKQFLYGYSDDNNKINLTDYIEKGHKLYYTIIYLAPGDYHRFHSPANGIKIDCINHIVGDLYPVKPSWLKAVPGLFSLNERMVMSGTWQSDLYFAYAPVGAFNIGSIHLKDDPYHMTNQLMHDDEIWYRQNMMKHCGGCKTGKKCVNKFNDGEELIYDKGDEIGHFSFGSTVVMVWEAPNFDFHIAREQKIRFGDALGDIGLFV